MKINIMNVVFSTNVFSTNTVGGDGTRENTESSVWDSVCAEASDKEAKGINVAVMVETITKNRHLAS